MDTQPVKSYGERIEVFKGDTLDQEECWGAGAPAPVNH